MKFITAKGNYSNKINQKLIILLNKQPRGDNTKPTHNLPTQSRMTKYLKVIMKNNTMKQILPERNKTEILK